MRCLVTKSNVMPLAATMKLSAHPNQAAKAAADLDEISRHSATWNLVNFLSLKGKRNKMGAIVYYV